LSNNKYRMFSCQVKFVFYMIIRISGVDSILSCELNNVAVGIVLLESN